MTEKMRLLLSRPHLEKRFEQLLPIFKSRWTGSMSEQIKELPPLKL
jgi:hypothetical protein